MNNEHSQGIALLCDEGGVIRKVILCNMDYALPALEGKPFSSLLAPGNFKPAMDFLLEIRRQKVVLGRQLEMGSGEQRRAFQFAGGLTAEGLLIIGAPGSREFERFYTDLTLINNEQSNLIRTLMKQAPHDQRSIDADAFEDMTKLNNELATLQRELAKKNHQLEILNEQKNQLLGMAAHDLRNPLGVIMSYAKFLQHMTGDRLQEKELQFVLQIEKSSQFMLRLLEDLLDVSQIESGKLNLKSEPVDFKRLIENNVKLNSELARQKNIAIALHLPATPMQLLADPNKLEQVLNNLISNALKYSHPDTQVSVTVICEGGMLLTRVRDQGQGIPEAELEKLFKPFSKTSVKSTAGEKSTGLGLVITKKIVEGHGGQVFVESRVGEGSSFGFSLPLVADS